MGCKDIEIRKIKKDNTFICFKGLAYGLKSSSVPLISESDLTLTLAFSPALLYYVYCRQDANCNDDLEKNKSRTQCRIGAKICTQQSGVLVYLCHIASCDLVFFAT